MNETARRALVSVFLLALSTVASFADYTLNILHINDWHSRIESSNRFESICSGQEEERGECIGGAARLAAAIDRRRAVLAGENLLLLNGGDNFQGSLFYVAYQGAVEAEFLGRMGFDAMTVGNHEFDDGARALNGFLDAVSFPVLGANVGAAPGTRLDGRLKPSVVLEIGGERIGIIGAVTIDTPRIASPGPDISIGDDIAAIAAEVRRLQADGVNKIIALTHVGYRRDKELIAKISGVDVVVGGHSHALLRNDDTFAEGDYPTMVDNPGGYRVPVVQAASYSKYLGELRVVFDDAGVVRQASGAPLLLDKAIAPDAAVLARIKELGKPVEELKNRVVSETTAPIDGSRDSCRTRECAMGNLIADAMLARMRGQGVTIAIQNGGGIRASIGRGAITMGDVLAVLPFRNTLSTFRISGADLRTALEHGLSGIEEGKGQFLQVAGLRYAFDRSKPPNGGRLRNVELRAGEAWLPLDDAATYLAVTNNFIRAGGDGYALLAANAEDAYDFGPGLEQVVADYLAANRPFTPVLDGRIAEIGTAAAQPAAPPQRRR